MSEWLKLPLSKSGIPKGIGGSNPPASANLKTFCYTNVMESLGVFSLKQVGFLSPKMQVIFICSLIALAFITQLIQYIKTRKVYGRYPWRIYIFFSSIYEEVVFRGFILFGLLIFFSPFLSIIISSVLFGLWHLRNYRWQTKRETLHQVLYTGLIFGPIASMITIWTGTIWITVILHYIHNLTVDILRRKNI